MQKWWKITLPIHVLPTMERSRRSQKFYERKYVEVDSDDEFFDYETNTHHDNNKTHDIISDPVTEFPYSHDVTKMPDILRLFILELRRVDSINTLVTDHACGRSIWRAWLAPLFAVVIGPNPSRNLIHEFLNQMCIYKSPWNLVTRGLHRVVGTMPCSSCGKSEGLDIYFRFPSQAAAFQVCYDCITLRLGGIFQIFDWLHFLNNNALSIDSNGWIQNAYALDKLVATCLWRKIWVLYTDYYTEKQFNDKYCFAVLVTHVRCIVVPITKNKDIAAWRAERDW